MIINFTIRGNQEDPSGNAVPYVRSTRGALWRPEGKRYAAWKGFVQGAFLDSLEPKGKGIAQVAIVHHGKPIILLNNQKAVMDMAIYWRNGAHGDPDNIFKGIADALFLQDRNLDGSFQSSKDDQGKGRVEVKITIQ